ncbi:MAG: hypothetical protein HY560_05005 [Gemmatimonadetes bacterium]|nr:hypothetical protein [Gemmatimonadota bacterium]
MSGHRLFPTPALDAWRRELATGKRSATSFDWLWRAACAEAWALDYAQDPQTAEGFLRDARRIVEDAARRMEQSA